MFQLTPNTIQLLQPIQHAPGYPQYISNPSGYSQGYLSGQHPGTSSPSSVPYATTHTPSTSLAGQAAQSAESGRLPVSEEDPTISIRFDIDGQLIPSSPLTVEEQNRYLVPSKVTH
uniref:Uncharacterized protein n=1 Tax=Melanopsichium pennsylvanicum 4 TaxID=1398559 RepID=A0A077RB03_9BASI|nr:uncharacterized protein BN887_03255 [Melanopsichium pennsylvanicum 4]